MLAAFWGQRGRIDGFRAIGWKPFLDIQGGYLTRVPLSRQRIFLGNWKSNVNEFGNDLTSCISDEYCISRISRPPKCTWICEELASKTNVCYS